MEGDLIRTLGRLEGRVEELHAKIDTMRDHAQGQHTATRAEVGEVRNLADKALRETTVPRFAHRNAKALGTTVLLLGLVAKGDLPLSALKGLFSPW